jgi:hypothetical protein
MFKGLIYHCMVLRALLESITTFVYTAPFYELLFVNEITNTVMFAYRMHVHSFMYTPT